MHRRKNPMHKKSLRITFQIYVQNFRALGKIINKLSKRVGFKQFMLQNE